MKSPKEDLQYYKDMYFKVLHKLNVATDERDNFSEELEALKQELKTPKKKKGDKEEKCKSEAAQQKKLDKLKGQLAEATTEKDTALAKLKIVRLKLKQLKRKSDGAATTSAEEAEAKSALEADLESLKKQLEAVKTERDTAVVKFEDLMGQVAEKDYAIEGLQKELENTKKNKQHELIANDLQMKLNSLFQPTSGAEGSTAPSSTKPSATSEESSGKKKKRRREEDVNGDQCATREKSPKKKKKKLEALAAKSPGEIEVKKERLRVKTEPRTLDSSDASQAWAVPTPGNHGNATALPDLRVEQSSDKQTADSSVSAFRDSSDTGSRSGLSDGSEAQNSNPSGMFDGNEGRGSDRSGTFERSDASVTNRSRSLDRGGKQLASRDVCKQRNIPHQTVTCSTCSVEFTDARAYHRHCVPEYRCNICSKSFPYMCEFYEHLKTSDKYHCVSRCSCNKQFNTIGSMRQHYVARHRNMREFRCSHCNFFCFDLKVLWNHEVDHNCERILNCRDASQ